MSRDLLRLGAAWDLVADDLHASRLVRSGIFLAIGGCEADCGSDHGRKFHLGGSTHQRGRSSADRSSG